MITKQVRVCRVSCFLCSIRCKTSCPAWYLISISVFVVSMILLELLKEQIYLISSSGFLSLSLPKKYASIRDAHVFSSDPTEVCPCPSRPSRDCLIALLLTESSSFPLSLSPPPPTSLSCLCVTLCH